MAKKLTSLDDLVREAEWLLQGNDARRFLAVAGAPASGKSTLAEALFERLAEAHPGRVAILPMDGFHFDDAVLHAMGRRPWKGAPDTFDVGGLRSILNRLKDPNEGAVAVPVFDRSLEISRGSARIIEPDATLIIVEGNYLLLDEAPWSDLAACFDKTVMIEVSEDELRARLRARWEHFNLDEEAIRQKLEDNDLPNGQRVIRHSRPADILFVPVQN